MTAIELRRLETTGDATSRWHQVATQTLDWFARRGIVARDTIVLLPFAALLPPARAAFAAQAAWLPRIETALTLAASLGPAENAGAGQLAFDRTLDRLSVAQLLRGMPWGASWARSDPRAFEQAVAAVVDTAHGFARHAASLAPADRAARVDAWRAALAPFGGPGARQRALAQFALEWSCGAATPATDRLFALRPAAWVVVQAGGPDALAQTLVESTAAPALWLDLDPDAPQRFDPPDAPAFALCDDFEHEAQCGAAQVIEHLRRDEAPVALISQDRTLVRRVRALLERQGVALVDETGWTLSTTRAAAQLMALLKAARPGASTDTLLDWLKTGTRWSAPNDGALQRLEAQSRKAQRVRIATLGPDALDGSALELWHAAAAVLAALHAPGRLPLPDWLERTALALRACGAFEALQDDDAGRQVLAQLHLGDAASGGWAQRLAGAVPTYAEFVDWVDGVLEQATYLPAPERRRPADVIITPLARAMLRPFRAVVCPGADARRLGAPGAPHPLLGEATLRELGLPDTAQRRVDESLAFAQLLRLPRLTLLRRRRDGDEPLAESPLVERVRLALARRGAALAAWVDPRVDLAVDAAPVVPSAGVAPALLPPRLSASACEALRACPYRFFALNVLGAREADELDETVEKRDYGTWLHEVLLEFHTSRAAEPSAGEDAANLRRIGERKRAAHALDAADFEPFAASFEAFVPLYVRWQQARDAQGERWLRGEREVRWPLPGVPGIELEGVIDRIDELPAEPGAPAPRLRLLDYKTGSASALKEKMRDATEDTQLAFYAALMRGTGEVPDAAPLQAAYLPLDGRHAIAPIEHQEVDADAALLVDGLARDLRRLRDGAGMAPLGESPACDHCAARGVCRRDHWREPADSVADAAEPAGGAA